MVGSISLVFCMEIARLVLYVIYFFLFRLGISVYNDVLCHNLLIPQYFFNRRIGMG